MDRTDGAFVGLEASGWDLWRDETGHWPDRDVWRQVVAGAGEPVLDLGCATGRLLLDLLADGVDADGLDVSAEMLDIVRAKVLARDLPMPALFQQRLQDLAAPRRYRTILASSSVLQLVTDPAEVRGVLHRILEHLEPGGALAASFDFVWRDGDPIDTGWELLYDERRPDDGARLRCWAHEWQEPERQLWHTEQRFEVEVGGTVVSSELHRRSPEGRWYRQDQIRELFLSAGFGTVELFSGFTDRPVQPEDGLLWVRAVKPG